MNQTMKRLSLLALSIAAAVMVAACGGGDSLPPGAATYVPPPAALDTVAPTVAITSSAAGTTAHGNVTFTFTFSEGVGSSFSDTDVTVTGGIKGTFTMVSGTVATLVVTPTANAAGSIAVSVDAGKFSDLFSNSNASASMTTQAYDTTPGSGGGGSTALITFDETPAVQLTDFGTNGAPPVIANDPAGGANMVLKIFKYKLPAPGSEQWAGVTISTIHGVNPALDAGSVAPLPFSASAKTMTIRVWSPAVGVRVRLKVEDASNNGISCETDAITTTANAWETLTFDFANPGTSPPVGGGATSPLDLTKTYSRLSVFMDFGIGNGGSGALPSDRTYYIDDVTFVGGASGGGGGGTSGPTAAAPTPPARVASDVKSIFSDAYSAIAGIDLNPNWGQTTVPSTVQIAGNATRKYATLNYQGIDFAGNPIDVSAMTKLHLDFWTTDVTALKVSIIAANGENPVSLTPVAGWNSADIDLALYTVPNKTAIIQIKIEGTPVGGTLYFDNLYFWKPAGSGGGGSCGTTVPTCAPITVIPSGSTTIYSDAASIANLIPNPDWGQSPPVVYSEPTIAGNKSLKYVWAGPGGLYEGIDWAANSIDVSAKGKLHLDFWTSDVTSVKVSIIGGGGENAVTQALTAGNWNSIDIDLALYTGPDKTKIIQIKLEPLTAGTLYVDNIYFWGTASSGGGGGGVFAGGVYADDYVGTLPSTAKSTQGGDVGFFYDSRFDGTGNSYTYGGVSGTAQDPAGVHNFYFGLGLNAPAITNGYFGAYVKSPGNSPVNVATFANLKLNVWGPDQLFKAGSFPALTVVMQGPAAAGCGSNSGGSEIQTTFNTTTQGAASIYTLPLSAFTLTAGCGGDTTVAQVLAHIAQVNVLLQGTNIQYINKDPNGVAFTNGLNVGSIKFN